MSEQYQQRVEYLAHWCLDGTWDLSHFGLDEKALRVALAAAFPGVSAVSSSSSPAAAAARGGGKRASMSSSSSSTSPPVTRLYLGGNRLGPGGAAALAEHVRACEQQQQQQQCASLVAVDFGADRLGRPLGGNGLGDDGAAHAAALVAAGRLRELNLALCDVGAAGARALAGVLASPGCALLVLGLRGNRVGDPGAAAIADALRANTSLRALSLAGNGIGPAGAAALGGALAANPYLRAVDLGWNAIGQLGATELAKALASGRCHISDFRLGRNGISNAGATCVFNALRTNTGLAKLWLDGNKIGDAAALELAAYFRSPGAALRELHLSCNSITDQGAAAIRQALAHNSALVKLALRFNPIADKTLLGAISLITERNASSQTQHQQQSTPHRTSMDAGSLPRTASSPQVLVGKHGTPQHKHQLRRVPESAMQLPTSQHSPLASRASVPATSPPPPPPQPSGSRFSAPPTPIQQTPGGHRHRHHHHHHHQQQHQHHQRKGSQGGGSSGKGVVSSSGSGSSHKRHGDEDAPSTSTTVPGGQAQATAGSAAEALAASSVSEDAREIIQMSSEDVWARAGSWAIPSGQHQQQQAPTAVASSAPVVATASIPLTRKLPRMALTVEEQRPGTAPESEDCTPSTSVEDIWARLLPAPPTHTAPSPPIAQSAHKHHHHQQQQQQQKSTEMEETLARKLQRTLRGVHAAAGVSMPAELEAGGSSRQHQRQGETCESESSSSDSGSSVSSSGSESSDSE